MTFLLRLSTRALFVIGLAVYGLTAWFSEGYHHPDEHFQVLEMAHYQLGRASAADLPWELQAQIRPGLQPMLACAAIRAAEFLGIDNPFTQAFLLRLLTGWLCLWLFFRWSAAVIRARGAAPGQWLLLAAVFGWFVPYLAVRFSSENLAGMVFLAGAFMLLQSFDNHNFKSRIPTLLLAGFLLGISFFFRFQMGFALLGVGAWLIFFRKKTAPEGQVMQGFFALVAGGLCAVALGAWADAWLYGEPAFTAYNYFKANIIENKAAYWGTAPWWFYFVQSLLDAAPPISGLWLGLAGVGFWRGRGGLLAWAFVPFLLAHVAVGHKEMRFMFPMIFPVLVWSVEGFRFFLEKYRLKKWHRLVFGIAVGLNFCLLPVRCLLPAQEAVPYFRFLYEYAEIRPRTVFTTEKSLYHLVGLEAGFYRSARIQSVVAERFEDIQPAPGDLLLSRKTVLMNPPPGVPLQRVYTFFPDWFLRFNPNNWQERSRIWSVYEVQEVSGE